MDLDEMARKLDSSVDKVSNKLDRLLALKYSSNTSFLPAPQNCSIYSSPTYFTNEYPVTYHSPEFINEPVYQDQTQMAYRPGNNPYFNDYNSGWGAQPDFSWQPHPVVTPVIQESTFVDMSYYDMPYPSYLPPQQTNLDDDRFAQLQQLIMTQQQSIDRLEIQIGQLATTLSREEEGELPSQPESNQEGQYLAQNFHDPQIFSEQSSITLGNELVMEQPCIPTKTNIDSLTEAETYKEQPDWWDEPISSSSYLHIAPFPSTLESPTPFDGKEEQIDEMMELVETSQEPQLNNTIREATPTNFTQDLLDPCPAQFRIDNSKEHGYTTEINNETPYFETTPIWIKEHEPLHSPSIVPLLESPRTLETKLLPDAPTDTLPVILSQEAQLRGVLKEHKKAIGWDIINMRDHDFNNFMIDFSIFGPTFENRLQNLSMILKRCMETDLMIIWINCQSLNQEGMLTSHIIPEKGIKMDHAIIDKIPKLPFPISAQQSQSFPGYLKNFNNIFRSWYSVLAQYSFLIWATRRRKLYERFSAMMTRPPDWPYSLKILRDATKFFINLTPS